MRWTIPALLILLAVASPILAEPDAQTLAALRRIHAPQVVGVPPANACRGLMVMPDGEIRHYGFRIADGGDRHDTVPIYISSHDYGLSWRQLPVEGDSAAAMVRSPWSGDYLTVLCQTKRPNHSMAAATYLKNIDTVGLHAVRSSQGPGGPFEHVLAGRRIGFLPRLPLPLRHRQRWVQPIQCSVGGPQQPGVLLSDDDGKTWRQVLLPSPPAHQVEWPHQGVRWQNYGCEPSVVELSDGRLWMLIRTSQDHHYEAFSNDGGDTWTDPAPSRFYASITMPLLFRLSDGRILVVWNNTTPLPELDHETQPGLNHSEREGRSEDFFTNRDAIHAAISDDDGKTWRGFRELHLNDHRNAADFRTVDGSAASLDKSIHQCQAVELPEGKVLLAFGQHPACRRLIIFDPDWLLETHRADDFSQGLGGWSVQQYVKSVPGNFRGTSGHCAYNRRPGAALVPHPDGQPREVLQVAHYPDPRLVHEKQGAVWNFPNAPRGRLTLRLRMPTGSQGLQICLVDRWFNPVDPVVDRFAQHVLRLDPAGRINDAPGLKPDTWADLEIQWDEQAARFRIDQGDWHPLPRLFPTRNGISYLHLQSPATSPDPLGVLIESVSATRTD
ncbi:exo-alpha-sialidase [Planctomycetales bacterium ZRK34]|nr:exo-alpha-sialidase [Planctomycetales bacterium ZRK34]